MSRGLGRAERAILAEIWRHDHSTLTGNDAPLFLHSWGLCYDIYQPRGGPGTFEAVWNYQPTRVQRQATVRAMRSFVRKHPRYGLLGGRGRGWLYLYERSDERAVQWWKLEMQRHRRASWNDAQAAIRDGIV